MSTLSNNHTIKSLLERRHMENTISHHLLLKNMTFKQWLKIKSFVIDTNNWLNRIFPAFDSLNNEFAPGFHLIDSFSSHFSFYYTNYKNKESKAAYNHKLDKCIFNGLTNFKTVVIVSDISIKNNIATFIIHVHFVTNFIQLVSSQPVS